MRKTVKLLLLAGLICCVAGSVLYFTGVASEGRKYVQEREQYYGEYYFNMARLENRVLKKTKVEDSEDAVSINAELEHVDLRIVESEDNCYYIEYEVISREEDPVSVETDGGVINIKESDAEFARVSFGGMDRRYDNKNYIVLYVPKGQEISEFSAVLGYGDCLIEGLKAEKAELSGEYSDFNLSGVSIKDGNAELEYGDFKYKDADIRGDVEFNLEYGDINLEFSDSCAETLSITAETGFGDIKVEDGFGGNNTENNFGTLYKKETENTQGRLTINLSYGDMKIE